MVASKDLQDLQFDRLTRIGERVDSNKNRLEKKEENYENRLFERDKREYLFSKTGSTFIRR